MTTHFTLKELTATSTQLHNVPREIHKKHLKWIANKLEFIRSCYNRPLYVDSAFRSPEVNKAVGGSSNSLHLLGLAVDIYITNISYKEMPKFLEFVLKTDPYEIHMNSEKIMHISWHPNKVDIFQKDIESINNIATMVKPELVDKIFTTDEIELIKSNWDNLESSFNNNL